MRIGEIGVFLTKQPAWPLNISHATCHIQHSTSNTQHSTSNTPHSQHPSPKSTRFFPTAPHPASKNAILAHLCNHLTFNHLPSKEPVRYPTRPIPHHEKPCFAPPSLPFRGSISYLSRLDPLPFATRYMPNAPFRPSRCPLKTPKKTLSPLYFARKSNTRFTPKFATIPFGCAD